MTQGSLFPEPSQDLTTWQRLYSSIDPMLTALGYPDVVEEDGMLRFRTLDRRIRAALERLTELETTTP